MSRRSRHSPIDVRSRRHRPGAFSHSGEPTAVSCSSWGAIAAMMAVDVTPGATLETGPVRTLFETSLNPTSQVHYYAVTRDGKRFLVREGVGSERTPNEPLYIVTNWTSLIR